MNMKELVEAIAKAVVDLPDQVQIRVIEGEQTMRLELRVDPSDVGKMIGREGRIVESVRIILAAAGVKLHKHIRLKILE